MDDKLIDKHEIFNIYKSCCSNCKYLNVIKLNCEAYPDVIPNRFLDASETHLSIQKDQNGNITFTQK